MSRTNPAQEYTPHSAYSMPCLVHATTKWYTNDIQLRACHCMYRLVLAAVGSSGEGVRLGSCSNEQVSLEALSNEHVSLGSLSE